METFGSETFDTYLLKEKAVKAESKRVEAVMKKLAAQQVQQEKDEGQKRLEEALAKAREEFLLEKSEAIQKAREEEKATNADMAKKVAQGEEEKRKQIILAAEKEKQVSRDKLSLKRGQEIEERNCCMELHLQCFGFKTRVKPPVATTSCKRPPLLGNQFSKNICQKFPSQIIIF